MGKTERSKWAGAHESTWGLSEFQHCSFGLRDLCDLCGEGVPKLLFRKFRFLQQQSSHIR